MIARSWSKRGLESSCGEPNLGEVHLQEFAKVIASFWSKRGLKSSCAEPNIGEVHIQDDVHLTAEADPFEAKFVVLGVEHMDRAPPLLPKGRRAILGVLFDNDLQDRSSGFDTNGE